jgi:hypothetical protein
MPRWLTGLQGGASLIWPSAAARFMRGRHWLTAPREPLKPLRLPSTYAGRFAVLGIVLLLFVLLLRLVTSG